MMIAEMMPMMTNVIATAAATDVATGTAIFASTFLGGAGVRSKEKI